VTEHAFKPLALAHLRGRGGWWCKLWGSACIGRGFPDVIGCFKGRFVALELKDPRYKDPMQGLEPAQRLKLKKIAEAGAYVAVVNTIAQIDALLDSVLI
jgi:hypothetical protein